MGIEDVADELYGLAPEDFTAARNARAAGRGILRPHGRQRPREGSQDRR